MAQNSEIESFASKVYRHFGGDQFPRQKLFFRYDGEAYPISDVTSESLKYGDNWHLYANSTRYSLCGITVKRSLLGPVVTIDMGDRQ